MARDSDDPTEGSTARNGKADDGSDSAAGEGDLPPDVVTAAERLTRLARRAVDEREAAAYRRRRDERLAARGFRARIREESAGDVLVCYPAEWLVGGEVRTSRVEDTDRAHEIRLSGPGDPDAWERVDEHNREIAAAVRAEYGDVHGDTAAALADFAGNHYAKRLDRLTAAEVREFAVEYFPRNAWPSDAQRDRLAASLRHAFAIAGVDRHVDLAIGGEKRQDDEPTT